MNEPRVIRRCGKPDRPGDLMRRAAPAVRLELTAMALMVAIAAGAVPVRSQEDLGVGGDGQARVRLGVSCLKLRQEPDPQSLIDDCLTPGTEVSVLEEEGEWQRVRLEDGREGWMAASYLDRLMAPSLPGLEAELPEAPAVAERPTGILVPESRDREQLERQAGDLETNVARLEQIVAEYRAAEADLIERRTATQESLRELRLREEAASAEEEELIRRVGSAETSVLDLRRNIEAGKATERDLETELEETSAALASTREALAEVQDLEASVGEEVQGSLTRISEMEGAIERSHARRERLSQELRTSLEAIDRLQGQVAAAVVLEDDLARRVGELEAGVAALDSELGGSTERFSELERAVEMNETAQEAMGRQFVEERERELRLRRDLETATGTMSRLETKVAQSVSQAGEVDFEVQKLTSQLADLDEQAATLEADLVALVESLGLAKRSESAVSAGLAHSVESLRELEDRDSAVRARLDGEIVVVEEGREDMAGEADASTAAEADRVPVAEPAVAANSPDAESKIGDVVRAWAAAWESGRVGEYLAFYAAGFRPADGSSREFWEANRRRRIESASNVRIELEDLSVVTAQDRATVRFVQAYESAIYADRVVKRLELVRLDGTWKITRETVELAVSHGR